MKTSLLIAVLCLLAFAAAGATPTAKERVQVVYQGSPGAYQLYIFGGEALRCPAANLHVTRDERADGDGPIVVECR